MGMGYSIQLAYYYTSIRTQGRLLSTPFCGSCEFGSEISKPWRFGNPSKTLNALRVGAGLGRKDLAFIGIESIEIVGIAEGMVVGNVMANAAIAERLANGASFFPTAL